MKKAVLFSILLMAAFFVQAQPSVCGRLVSDKDQQPIPFANIAMMRASDTTFLRGVITDEKGLFSIDNDTLPTLLRLSAMGYETQFVAVPSTRDQGPTGKSNFNMGTLVMHEGAMLLDMVKVTDKRPLYSVDGEKDLYNVSEDASVQTGNASDVLQNAPGVQVDVQGNITLNGNSVTIWINDRPSHLDGEALRQYIKTLPANAIERVEVMKNPSAKYGSGGPVINIVTNRKLLKNSFFSFGANGNSQPAIMPWVSYVYSNDKFNVSAYIGGYGGKDFFTTSSDGRMFDSDSNMTRDYQSVGRGDQKQLNSWMGINGSYQFDSLNTLTAWFSSYPQWYNILYKGSCDRTEYLNGVPADYGNNNQSENHYFGIGGYGGADYTHRFNDKGHQISFGANFQTWNSNYVSSNFEHFPFQPQMSYDENKVDRRADAWGDLGIDYSLPYSEKGEIEAGLELEFGKDRKFYLRDSAGADGIFHCDYLRSDTAFNPGNQLSSYLTWRRNWGNFTLKLGGRLEYKKNAELHLGSPQYDTTIHYLCAEPSLHMSYRTENLHNFSLGYTFHHNHPLAYKLSRYITYGTETVTTGNPLLQPEYVHNLDASWNKYFDKFGSVGVSGSFKADLDEISNIEDVRYVDLFGRNVAYTQPFNAGDSRRGDLSVNCMYRPTAFFNVRLSSGVTDSWYRVQVRPDKWVEDEMVSWNVSLRLWAKLWDKLEVFASGYYNSREHSGEVLEINEPRKGIDLGMSADLLDRKLSLYLNVSDIFDWNNWNSTKTNPYNFYTNDYKAKSRYITFGATFRFGKMELESQARTGATEGGGKR